MSKSDKEKKKGAEKFANVASEFVNPTPKGGLKDFSKVMADSYQPQEVEAAWDSWWEKCGLFAPDLDSKAENFVIVIPPPNVTGTLHLGHAYTVSIEDSLTRWHRMSGRNALWVPGTDHAGIATQVVVEKKLKKEQQKTRHDLGREKFIQAVWEWKEKHGDTICHQLRRIGASVDWGRIAFTMDDRLSAAVKEAFIRMYKSGLIYRANRLVNWDCFLRTAISNIEVEQIELKGSTKLRIPGYAKEVEFGVLHEFSYPVLDSHGAPTSEHLTVATTRIETMLGDVAVAVHPDDSRYKHLIGKKLKHPFVENRHMIVIGDPILVDMTFGSGAVKVTPAHDPNDFKCGQRNQLSSINIFTDDGKVNENGGKYAGKPRFEVRELIIEDLKQLNLYKGKKDNPMTLGLASRSHDVVEPVMRPQWWINCSPMAKRALAAVKEGALRILPENPHTAIWNNWLKDIQDWCISRQLWWGHRIPAYFIHVEGENKLDDENDNWVVANDEKEAVELAAKRKGVPVSKIRVEQDPDVLDTWFSSGLFPFSTLGWPNDTADMKKFYPNTILETGVDILFFWVARMVMMGLELTDQLPFHTVYLHMLIRDKWGRKMSKSLGNVIDPLDIIYGITLDQLHAKLKTGNLDEKEIEKAKDGQKKDFPDGIAECGADALRFGLLSYTSQSGDVKLDIQKVVAFRQFCNKMWNATKFALRNFSENASFTPSATPIKDAVSRLPHSKCFGDTWIFHRLVQTVTEVDKSWIAYDFGSICNQLYHFFLHELCDNYLELIKPVMYDDMKDESNVKAKEASLAVLYLCLHAALRLIHPIMPFITEELFHRLPGAVTDSKLIDEEMKKSGKRGSGSICVAEYPKPAHFLDALVDDKEFTMNKIQGAAEKVRQIRASLGLTKERPEIIAVCSSADSLTLVQRFSREICTLGSAKSISVVDAHASDYKAPHGAVSIAVDPTLEFHLSLSSAGDVSKLLLRMEKSVADLKKAVDQDTATTTSKVWLEKSKAEVKEEILGRLKKNQDELAKNSTFLHSLLAALTPEQKQSYYVSKLSEKSAKKDLLAKKLDDANKKEKKDAKTEKLVKDLQEEIAGIDKEIDEIKSFSK